MIQRVAEIPALTAGHLASNARLFASREDLVASLAGGDFQTIAEIGVGLGDFSLFLIKTLKPKSFWAFDVFAMHESPEHWGRSSAEIFGRRTHLEFYKNRLAGAPVSLSIEV